MESFTIEELRILLFLTRNRLHYESRRPRRMRNGQDIQTKKVWELKEIMEKIERKVALNAPNKPTG